MPDTFKWNSKFWYYTVRKPYPSTSTSVELVFGKINNQSRMTIISHIPENGVIFSDGIEQDFIEFNSGASVAIGIANKKRKSYSIKINNESITVMTGTIEYSSTINSEPIYRLINFENGNIYAVEIMSLSGKQLSDLFWVPANDICCALFALTQDEFELKDSDVKTLDNLVKELYNNIPEDWLIEAYYRGICDKQRRPITNLRPGCETMYDNK